MRLLSCKAEQVLSNFRKWLALTADKHTFQNYIETLHHGQFNNSLNIITYIFMSSLTRDNEVANFVLKDRDSRHEPT